ncbi:MAG: hypothetical protein II206_10635, partial [Bacteroidaceae bacterium]|nr:hypothetical protein [Bacteroidaceae bacterium]
WNDASIPESTEGFFVHLNNPVSGLVRLPVFRTVGHRRIAIAAEQPMATSTVSNVFLKFIIH